MPAAVTRSLLVLLFLTWRLSAAAQAPSWQSARAVAVATAAAASNDSRVNATAVDAAGNVYVAGSFANTVALGGITLVSLGSDDIFVAKFNPTTNQFLWAQRAGSTSYDAATALAVSGTNVYLTGFFNGLTAEFGSTTLINTNTNTNFSTSDIFVTKLIDAGSIGSFAWAQRAGGTGADYASSLAVSGASVYVVGNFRGATAGFGSTTLTNAGYINVFVAKITDSGNTGSFVWAQQAGGSNNDEARALAVRGTSVYVAGRFASPTATFGTIALTNVSNSTGLADVFVAKLTDAGNTGSFVWAQRAGGTQYDEANSLVVSGTSVYVAGAFASSTASFGNAMLTNTGSVTFDLFVAKLTDAGSTGSFTWAQRAGGTGGDFAYALAVGGTSVYVAGIFDSATADFGSATLSSTGTYDVYVAKLADGGNAGNFVWAQRAGGIEDDEATALVLNGKSVYVAGSFGNPTAGFGTTILTNPDPNTHLGFLASLTDATLTATTVAAGPREPAVLFPNPARRTATLRLSTGMTFTPLVLTDALGQAVRYYPAPTGAEAVLDLQGLAAGLYLVRGAGLVQRLAVE